MFDCMEMERLPRKCETHKCRNAAAWSIYNRKIKQKQEFCPEHVPPEGTPRIGKYVKIQRSWCWVDEIND